MWPKVIAQLFDLLPHVSRLLPMADRFLNSKVASEKASEAALGQITGQITESHGGLNRQLQDQGAQIAGLGEEIKSTRLAVEQHEGRMQILSQQVDSLGRWVRIGVSLLVILSAAVLVLLSLLLHSR